MNQNPPNVITRPGFKKRNYTPAIVVLTLVVNGLVAVLAATPGVSGFDRFDVKVLPRLNAIFNTFTFLFLSGAFLAIRKRNVLVHRRLIYAAFGSTTLFLVTYAAHHFLAEPTAYGGGRPLADLYYFTLVTHIVLAAAVVPLALVTVSRAWNMEYRRHRNVARWTMPIWLYVSFTGVLVYVLISPYY